MKDTLRVINQMQADGVIGKYAIGGAIGATFYLQPTATFDLDIFISFKETPGQVIVSLQPIYSYLQQRGCKVSHEHINVGGWDVQFLPADTQLYREALSEAVVANVGGVSTSVMRAEHLMAIALQTGRAKDMIRLEEFIRAKKYEPRKLQDILSRNGLLEKWCQFNEKYLGS